MKSKYSNHYFYFLEFWALFYFYIFFQVPFVYFKKVPISFHPSGLQIQFQKSLSCKMVTESLCLNDVSEIDLEVL